MNVILDTNIFVNDFMMKSKNFIVFLEYSRKMSFDIYVPELVRDEILNKFKEKLIEQESTYSKSVRELSRYIVQEFVPFNIDIEVELKKYNDYLVAKFKEYNIRTIKYPRIEHKDVVRYALSRKKPFKNNGSGYRDKLILESIFERFNVLEETTIFLSSNTNDFGNEPDFHDDILNECKVANKWNLKLCNSLNSYYEVYIKPIVPIDTSPHSIKEFDDYFGESFGDWLLNNLGDIIYDQELGYDMLDLEHGYGTVMLSKVDTINSIKVSNVLDIGSDFITFEVDIDTILILYVSANSPDMIESATWGDYFDYTSSDGNVDISTWPQLKSNLTFHVVIDRKSHSVVSNEIAMVKTEFADLVFI